MKHLLRSALLCLLLFVFTRPVCGADTYLGTKTVITSAHTTTNYFLVIQGTGTNAAYRLMNASNIWESIKGLTGPQNLNIVAVTASGDLVTTTGALKAQGTGGGTGLFVSGKANVGLLNVTNSINSYGWANFWGPSTNYVGTYIGSDSPLYFLDSSGNVIGSISGSGGVQLTNVYATNATVGQIQITGLATNALIYTGVGGILRTAALSGLTFSGGVLSVSGGGGGGGGGAPSMSYVALPASGIVGGNQLAYSTNLSADISLTVSNLIGTNRYYVQWFTTGQKVTFNNSGAWFFTDAGQGGYSESSTNAGLYELQVWKDDVSGRTNALFNGREYSLAAGSGTSFSTNDLTGVVTILASGGSNVTNSGRALPSDYPIFVSASAATALVSNITYLWRFNCPVYTSATNLTWRVSAGGTGVKMGVSIYSSSGTRLIDSGAIPVGGTSNVVVSTTTILAPGDYYLGWNANSLAATYHYVVPDSTRLSNLGNGANPVFAGMASNGPTDGANATTTGTIIATNTLNIPVVVLK